MYFTYKKQILEGLKKLRDTLCINTITYTF